MSKQSVSRPNSSETLPSSKNTPTPTFTREKESSRKMKNNHPKTMKVKKKNINRNRVDFIPLVDLTVQIVLLMRRNNICVFVGSSGSVSVTGINDRGGGGLVTVVEEFAVALVEAFTFGLTLAGMRGLV